MENRPKIGIVVPAYNVKPYIYKCLNSIKYQVYDHFNAIIVDDGSTDGTDAVCRDFCLQDGRFHLISHIENQGVSRSRNDAMRLLKGGCAYIIFIDADDWLEPSMLSNLISAAENSGSDIAICNVYDEYESGGNARPSFGRSGLVYGDEMRNFVLSASVTLWNKLIAASIAESVRFDDSLSYSEDSLYLAEVLIKSESMAVVDQPLYHYRIERNGNVVSSPLSRRHFDVLESFRRQVNLFNDCGLPLSAVAVRAAKALKKVVLRLGEADSDNPLSDEMTLSCKRFASWLIDYVDDRKYSLFCKIVSLSPNLAARLVVYLNKCRKAR